MRDFWIKRNPMIKFKSYRFIMKATQAEKDLAAKQAAFYDVMTRDYATKFADQKAIQDSLTAAFKPIIEAGPDQYGLSRGADTALRTSARDATTAAYEHAARATGSALAARGGDTFLPSGVDEQIRSQVATEAAREGARKQTDITRYGFDVGRTNFFNAASVLGGNAAQMNPTGFAGEATGAGSAAFKSAQAIQSQGGGFMRWLGGVAGGAISSFVNPLASAGASRVLGGGSSSSGGGMSDSDIYNSGFCWVAAELYGGWDSPRVKEIRSWLLNSTDPDVQRFAKLYHENGQKLAEDIRKSPELRAKTKAIFDKFPIVRKVNNNE